MVFFASTFAPIFAAAMATSSTTTPATASTITNNAPSTIVVGLNAALQKRFILPPDDSLIPGNVHRATQMQTGIGGKGQDVAITLSCLGYNTATLAQFCGQGPAGDTVMTLLQQRGLGDDQTVRSGAALRTCTSIVAHDVTTELVEPSGVISQEEMQELLTQKLGVAQALCIMGSMPPGCAPTTYAEVYRRVAQQETLCVVDSMVGTEELMEAMAAGTGRNIFKVNASELCKLAGVAKQGNEVDGIEVSELTTAIDAFFTKFAPHASKALCGLAITDGKNPSYFVGGTGDDSAALEVFQIGVPTLKQKTLFPIGAGDSVAAGTLAAWNSLVKDNAVDADVPILSTQIYKKLSGSVESTQQNNAKVSDERVAQMIAAFGFGLACGSASCLQEENSVVDIGDVLRLFESADAPTHIATVTTSQSWN